MVLGANHGWARCTYCVESASHNSHYSVAPQYALHGVVTVSITPYAHLLYCGCPNHESAVNNVMYIYNYMHYLRYRVHSLN